MDINKFEPIQSDVKMHVECITAAANGYFLDKLNNFANIMSEDGEKCLSQFSRALGDVFRLLFV